MAKERILIAVKTYPVISGQYAELSCTAGFRKDGSWIRLYPIPFRRLKRDKRYRKYQWIEADIVKARRDTRPESYRVTNADDIKILEKIDTSRAWEERRKIVLGKAKLYTNKKEIVDLAHKNKISLAVFKPTKIIDFAIEDAEPEWPPDKLRAALESLKQRNLFEDEDMEEFKIMPKIPKKFSYIFEDDVGKKSKLMIEDWEIGQLYLNCLKKYNAKEAIEKVRTKYIDDFVCTKDLHLFLGTTWEWHRRRAPNPYVIIGTFHPPFTKQPPLL